MPIKAKSKRRVRKVLGEGRPDSIYTVEGVMRAFGMGRNELDIARQSGMVKTYPRGRRAYYRGFEIIEWIVNGPKPEATDHE